MKPKRNYKYESTLAVSINGLIDEKRASGYVYTSNSDVLKQLDTFCLSINFNSEIITKELCDAWSVQQPTECLNSRNVRISVLRQLSKYQLSLGMDAYLPKLIQSSEKTEAHVFTADELDSFFLNLDDPKTYPRNDPRLVMECRTLFRLYYCCGMRLSEPIELTWDRIDYDRATIKILQSKGDKDRIIWLSDEIATMLANYRAYITKEVPETKWVFPGINPEKHINEVTVRDYFLKAWRRTPFSDMSNPPTIKSFRHTFVVDRLNDWMENGEDMDKMLPYLSKFLGHNSIHESLYYYHQVAESRKIIREKDMISSKVIPEVIGYETK